MATITIRNIPEALVERIKDQAGQKGVSMEQEIRNLLHNRYQERTAVLERIRKRWETLPAQSAEQLQDWKQLGRP